MGVYGLQKNAMAQWMENQVARIERITRMTDQEYVQFLYKEERDARIEAAKKIDPR